FAIACRPTRARSSLPPAAAAGAIRSTAIRRACETTSSTSTCRSTPRAIATVWSSGRARSWWTRRRLRGGARNCERRGHEHAGGARMNPLTALAAFVQRHDLAAMPPERLDRVKRHVLDTWAARMAGARTESGVAVEQLLRDDDTLSAVIVRCAQTR